MLFLQQSAKMTRNYFYIIIIFLFSLSLQAQEKTSDDLGFYPNPVTNGKIYITSKTAAAKQISIFDVLGKIVLKVETTTKELNVSTLSSGIYIIKIEEGKDSSTRKLIIR